MPILKNWQEEKRSAYLYRKVASREVDTIRRKLFFELAAGADKQASIWEEKLKSNGGHTIAFVYKPDIRTKLVGGLIHAFGIESIRFILSAMKVRGMSVYSASHGSHLAAANLETRHKGLNTAGNLRAAVFGMSDGLVSNVCLLLGLAGASADHRTILLTGIAGLLAGACSMAAGEYVSMCSQREFFEYQIELEKEELELYPEEEAVELTCIYRARGMPLEEARTMANAVVSNPETALNTLAREELGLNPMDLGSPIGAAISSFLSFAIGAFIPVLPFFMIQSSATILYSVGLAGIALFVIGGILSLFTNRNSLLSGLRMLVIGATAGAVTYWIGKLVDGVV